MSVKSFKTSGVGVDLAPPGLVLINTTSFSGVSSQSINNVFSATYRSYKIFFDSTNSTSTFINLRYRVAGADNSTGNYNFEALSAITTSVAGAKTTNGTSTNVCGVGTSFRAEILVNNPNLSANTGSITLGFAGDNDLRITGALFSATTVFDGFTLLPNAGTITGSVSVYGLNN